MIIYRYWLNKTGTRCISRYKSFTNWLGKPALYNTVGVPFTDVFTAAIHIHTHISSSIAALVSAIRPGAKYRSSTACHVDCLLKDVSEIYS